MYSNVKFHSANIVLLKSHGSRRTKKGGGWGGYATPLNFRGGLNSCQPSLISEKLYSICIFIYIEILKIWTFYSVKILKDESFLITL